MWRKMIWLSFFKEFINKKLWETLSYAIMQRCRKLLGTKKNKKRLESVSRIREDWMHKRTHVWTLARELGALSCIVCHIWHMGIRCLRWQTGTPHVRLRPATMAISLPLFFLNFFACFLFFNHVSPLFRFLFHFP